MAIICDRPLDDRIVVFGQSCVGKTTFALQMLERTYHCFDALFQWHLIETLGLSIEANFRYIQGVCSGPRWVLDGWHLADKKGRYLPPGAVAYVVYAPYQQIISQYRVPVAIPTEHLPMFRKWYYEINYDVLSGVRYFRNDGDFLETSREDYFTFLARSQ